MYLTCASLLEYHHGAASLLLLAWEQDLLNSERASRVCHKENLRQANTNRDPTNKVATAFDLFNQSLEFRRPLKWVIDFMPAAPGEVFIQVGNERVSGKELPDKKHPKFANVSPPPPPVSAHGHHSPGSRVPAP